MRNIINMIIKIAIIWGAAWMFPEYVKIQDTNRIMQHLYDSYSKLIDYSAKSYLKSRGSRGTLNISAMAQSDKLFNEKLEKLMNEYFKSFFESPNAVLPLFEGYSYTDIGSKTYSAPAPDRLLHPRQKRRQ